MNENIHEIQKIKNQILTEKPNNIKDFVELFFRIYENDENVNLNNFISVIRELKLKVFIVNIGYEVDDSGLKTLLERRVSKIREEKNLFESKKQFENAGLKHPKFPFSDEYKFVKQFAKKFRNQANEDEYYKLQQLLKGRGWDLLLPELLYFVDRENMFQFSDNVKSKILSTNPQNRKEILKSYLNFFQPRDIETLKILMEVLREKLHASEDVVLLEKELQTIEVEIELENFEKKLTEENEQIFIEDIDRLNGYEFEEFLKNLFLKMGYQVEQTKLSGDQGADLVVVKFGEKTVIQAKRYGAKVGNYAVQEIMAAISLCQAQKGAVITNNYHTPAAFELAEANNIELIDRNDLEELIRKFW